MFGAILPPVAFRRANVLLVVFVCLIANNGAFRDYMTNMADVLQCIGFDLI